MIDPARVARWTTKLQEMATTPLERRPDLPEVAERWEAWWSFASDRPILIGTVEDAARGAGVRRDKLFDLLEQPEKWLEARLRQMSSAYWIDQSIPHVRVDIGPVAPGAFLGAPLHFAVGEDTSWQTPILTADDWDGSVPDADPARGWLSRTLSLAARTARDAAGKYLVALPDLSGCADILANLRGTERLLMDLYDRPHAVRRGCEAIVDSWETAFSGLYDAVIGAGSAPVSWLFAWSSMPYAVPTCDFNFMIGPGQFEEICLPSIREQARRAGRALFHLDGPGAAKHAPILARTPEITAVQYTPGAGTPSALARLDMLKGLQDAGKPILAVCPAAEAAELCRRLDRRGLVLWPEGLSTPEQARDLEAAVGAR
jgi:hypothetical protein